MIVFHQDMTREEVLRIKKLFASLYLNPQKFCRLCLLFTQLFYIFIIIQSMDPEAFDGFDFSDFENGQNPFYQPQELRDICSEESPCYQEEFGTPLMSRKEQNSGLSNVQSLMKFGEIPFMTQNLPQTEDTPSLATQTNNFMETSNNVSSTYPSNEDKRGIQPPSTEVEKSKKNKKDETRNLFPNVIKSANKKILQDLEVYDSQLEKVSRKNQQEGFEYISLDQFKSYCGGLKSLEFSLRDIYSLLNYNEGSKKEKSLKKMFHQFFVWYLEKRYTIEIIKSDQCQFKEQYLKGKNLLKYLPWLKQKKPRCSKKNTRPQKL